MIRRWLARLTGPSAATQRRIEETDAASHRVEAEAQRVEAGVDHITCRVLERNHITEAVAAVWGHK